MSSQCIDCDSWAEVAWSLQICRLVLAMAQQILAMWQAVHDSLSGISKAVAESICLCLSVSSTADQSAAGENMPQQDKEAKRGQGKQDRVEGKQDRIDASKAG